MPPRSGLLTKRWSLPDLPIFPFLAPRIFQPWPCTRRCVHSRTTQVAQQQTEAVREVYDDSSQNNGGAPEFNLPPRNAANLGYNELRRPGVFPGAEQPSETVEEQEFRRRYEEIWGRIKKQTPAVPVRRVQVRRHLRQYRHGQARGRQKANWALDGRHPRSRVPVKRVQRTSHSEARERARRRWANLLFARAAANRRQMRSRAQHNAYRRHIPLVRPKWARYLPGHFAGLYASFRSWNRLFGILNLRHENFMQGRKIPTLAPQQALRFPATFLRGLIEQESSVTLRLEWEKFRHRQKMAIWPELMIKTLQYHPEKAMKVLAGTYAQEPFPPPYAMSDCLNFIISHFLGRPGPHSTNFVRRLCNYIFRLLRIGPKEYFHISQHAIFLLLSKADSYCIKKLYETLSDLHHPLHQNTLMNFASRLAERRETDTAFEILRKLKSYDCDFNSPKMLSLCSSVLDRSNRGPTTSHSESDIFEYMLECGMQPNLITYNILIQNSLENENHSTAWQIHDMMLESGIEPDVYTYSILLNNSKRRRDSADIRKVMDMVEEKGMRNSYIITDILHAIFLLHQQRTRTSGQPHEPQTAFHHMLKVFLENFHIRPLVRIIPWISQESPESQMLETSPTIQAKFEHPPAPTLAVMITAFLHGLQSPRSVKQCYDHFRYLLSTGDPVLADLIQTTHIWNSFLMAFGRSRSTLEDCPMVIGDMFAPIHAASMTASSLPTDEIDRESAPGTNPISETHYSSSMVGVSEAESSKGLVQPLHASISAQDSKLRELENSEERPRKPHIPPKPDVYTWSILLKIFMDQRQTRAAERVLAMMQERGIQPNLVTWNTLAVGYARLQEERMTVDAISRLRGSGLTPDDITMASLRRIRDRRTLLEAMKRKEQKESKEEKDLLDRLIDDVRNVTDKELPLDFESADEDFVISDMKGFDDDMTMERIVDDSATQKEGGEEVETI